MVKRERGERGTGRLFLRGRVWWAQYYLRGAQIRVSCETEDEKKAKKFLRTRLDEKEEGAHRDPGTITFEYMRETYFQDYVINRRKSLRRDRYGNINMDKVNRLSPFFAGYRATEIDTPLMRRYILDQQKIGLSNGSINRSISALRRMFYLQQEDGKLRDLPFFPAVKEAVPRQGFFEPEEYARLLSALPDYLHVPFSMGYYTGMRVGEILRLEWPQLDFLRGFIRLTAGETKNDEPRDIPIIPQLRTILVERYAKRQSGCPYVCFRIDHLDHAVKIRQFRKAWYSSCVKAGLGTLKPAVHPVTSERLFHPPRSENAKPKAKMVYEGKSFHDLRRTGVRNLVRAGVPEGVAMKISGHLTRSVFERYNIVVQNDILEAGRKLAEYHSAKVGDNSGSPDLSTK